MTELLDKIIVRINLFLFGKKCPNCGVRKLIGTGLCGFEEGKMVFARICFNCFASYKSVDGKVTFEEFLDQNL
jgi:hypothetical protein